MASILSPRVLLSYESDRPWLWDYVFPGSLYITEVE